MGIFFKRKNDDGAYELNLQERTDEIRELEREREEINRNIEKLLVKYRRITGDKRATEGAKRIGKAKKDYSYWQKDKVFK